MIADKVEKLTLCGRPIILRKIILIYLSLLPNIAQADRFIDRPRSGNISHLNARYLDLITGRFLTQDMRKQFFSHYVYGNGRVILSSDPSGEVNLDYNAEKLIFDSSRTPQVVRGSSAPISVPHEKITAAHDAEEAKNTKSGNEIIQASSSQGNHSEAGKDMSGEEHNDTPRNEAGKDMSGEEHNDTPRNEAGKDMSGEEHNDTPRNEAGKDMSGEEHNDLSLLEDMTAPPDPVPLPDDDDDDDNDNVKAYQEKLRRIGAARSIEEYHQMVNTVYSPHTHTHKPRVMTEERLKAMGGILALPPK
ncbi:hypothetical protein [Bathymodiolus platifrons methanotrophic gill symbiont]|uniref:hypothetical protein n=1 Tax=Bathymodiolus platifrons methanotrophic gill symbiont TaxID=113268 RepID=UPI001C8F0863|nr:hypothetical protein [Bathymodiolus platifrons methanotrophic gill symbiont]